MGSEMCIRDSYWAFDRTLELDMIMRQQGQDDASARFRGTLDRLREEKLTQADFELLASRVMANNPDEIAAFADALRILPRRTQVERYNHNRLRDLQQAVLKLTADHTGQGAESASTEDAGNLYQSVQLSIGSRVMLLENLWTERGLVNGSFGTVEDIVWPSGTRDARSEPPYAILVRFDTFTGRGIRPETSPAVPILRSTREFLQGTKQCTRSQFPLVLAYAITVHKAQGITVDQAVLNISERAHTPGINYVAVSRVRTLNGILFEDTFNFDQIQPARPTPTMLMRLADRQRRLPQHISRLLPASSPSVVLPIRPSPRGRFTPSRIPVRSPALSSPSSSPSLRRPANRDLTPRAPPSWLLDHMISPSPPPSAQPRTDRTPSL